MKVTFPHMGHMHIILKSLFASLGCDVITPPPTSKRTMELGTMYSPETVCLPFKLTLGNFIEALELGADTIITCGGVGPCRLGYYGAVQKEILKSLGYKFEMVVVEPDLMATIRNIRCLSAGKSVYDIYQAFRLAGTKMYAVDNLEMAVSALAPRVVDLSRLLQVRSSGLQAIDNSNHPAELKVFNEDISQTLSALPLKGEANPLKIGLVGEIFVMLEAFVNQELEKRLAEMDVEVHKTMYLSDYVNGHIIRKHEYRLLYKSLDDLARPYLGHYVGGHGLKSVAYAVSKAQQGFDGMIQVYPFTCMPEVIAKNILPQVSKDWDIPVLTLAFDEQSGEAGILTRLEAFTDLLKYRRRQKRAL